MTNPYPKNSYIVNNGKRRKILGELDELRFPSVPEEFGGNWDTRLAGFAFHIEELKRGGWKEEGEKEKEWPRLGDRYFYF